MQKNPISLGGTLSNLEDPALDPGRRNRAEFVDMRHLKDNTRIRRAKVGVAYISEIAVEE